MNKNVKEIAIKLGIAVPACVLSISSLNAAERTALNSPKQDKTDFSENEVVELLTTSHNLISSEANWMAHSDMHTNTGGNHADRHSNRAHSDTHSNTNAKNTSKRVQQADGSWADVGYCAPHSDRHTNRNAMNTHTNSGNKNHTDRHSNRDSYYDCD